MKEKIVILCLKLSLGFQIMAQYAAYPDCEDKNYKVSWFGFKGDFNWQIGVIGFGTNKKHD